MAELALGVADAEARAGALAHLDRCPRCRQALAAASEVADRLVLLAPPAEPPAGFESRALAELGGRAPTVADATVPGRWRRAALAVAAAVVAAALGVGGWLVATRSGGAPGSPAPAVVAAALRHDGHPVGEVVVAGGKSRPWLSVAVVDGPARAAVRCEVVGVDGSTTVLGTFAITAGYGYWAAPLPTGTSVRQARLVLADGTTVATATVGWPASDGR